MSGNKDSMVVERPDDIEIPPPSEPYTLIEPFEFFNNSSESSKKCLIILNQSIRDMNLERLWPNTRLHICADGGANQLFHYFEDESDRSKFVPEFITGDCDSVTDEVKQYYILKGTVVIPQYSQYSTDLTKSILLSKIYFHSESLRQKLYNDIEPNNGLSELGEPLNASNPERVFIYMLGGIGGRFDQTIHSINQLYKLNKSDPHLQIFFISHSDMIFLIKKGLNYIQYERKSLFNTTSKTPICGLLPLSNSPITLNTYGLKYDVFNWKSSMVGDVSSSNGICGINGFIVNTTDDIVMNASIDHY
mmetsp:Transcript_3496/g.3894  ORF Transcript_3496/g.3894 Transcript_3496/m.3894 type:complete len:305 (-) Transcript_3496:51-965(-)